jgi:thiosulfate/3-mercaptopyruvate sulfurtransferase
MVKLVTLGRVIPPLVSTNWLTDNINLSRLIIIDIRGNEDYLKGHIPNAVNVPFALPTSSREEFV